MTERKKSEKVWGHFYRSAGGRFKEDPAPEMTVMRNEYIPLKGIHMFDKAHVIMLMESKIISQKDGIKILQALLEMEKRGYETERKQAGGGGHSGEAYLIKKLGLEIGGQIHAGRSSADLIAVAVRIEQREKIIDILDKINILKGTLIRLSQDHLESLIPAYTHFQQAQPITLAHYLTSWIYALNRDFDRFMSLYKRTNVSPAGSAIVSGSPFPINRERVAELLGFNSVIQNTRDAIFGYDQHLEFFSNTAVLNNTLARMCSDIYIWCSYEFDMAELPDRFCGTSSINPHKKNPQALEQIFSLAALAVGKMNTAFAVDRMPSESWEIQWRVWSQELWPLLTETVQGLVLINSVFDSLNFKTERMRELTKVAWTTGADLAALLVTEYKQPWRIAHKIVGQLVKNCADKGIVPQDVSPEMLIEVVKKNIGKKISVSSAMLKKALDPKECVEARQMTGGPAPEQVVRQIDDCMKTVKKEKKQIADLKSLLKKAEKKLDHTVKVVLAKENK